MSAADARFAARRAFGGQVEQTKQRHRDARSFRWLDESWLDFKLGARMLIKYPGLSLIGGTAMAVAIAFGAGSFAFFYAYAYGTLPFEDGERIVGLENWHVERNNEARQSMHDFLTWREEMTSVESISAFRAVTRNVLVPGRSPELVRIAEMTPSGFRVAGVAPALGRALRDEDARPGAPPVVVVGHDVWQSHFASDPAVIGRELRLGRVTHTIVGIMPEGFKFPVNDSYWVPLDEDTSTYQRGQGPAIFIFGRLASWATEPQAQAELTTLGLRAAAAFPETHAQLRPQVLPYAHPVLDIQGISVWQLSLMQGTVSLLLAIVAINVSILIYARTATRQSEIAVRTALGASRSRIVMQLFIEALTLSAVSAVAGLGLAKVGLRMGHQIMREETGALPFWIDDGIAPLTLVYVAVMSVLGALIAGVLPAIQATGRGVQSTLRQLAGATGLRLGRTWTMLIVAQVALAVAGLPVALSMGWSEIRTGATWPTFDAKQYLLGSLGLELEPPPGVAAEEHRRQSAQQFVALKTELSRRLEAEAGVRGLSFTAAPAGNGEYTRVEIEGLEPPTGAGGFQVTINRVDERFFALFDARVLTGRGFEARDFEEIQPTLIVSRSFVDRVLGGGNALGRRVRYVREPARQADAATEEPWMEIVGVVGDLYANSLDSRGMTPDLYRPLTAASATGSTFTVRVAGDLSAVAARIREIVFAIDPTLRFRVRPFDDVFRQQRIAIQLVSLILGLIAASVLLLSAAGIYALMSFVVAQHRKEIGIRIALGADQRRLLASVLSRALRQLTIGVAMGAAIAFVADLGSEGELMAGQGAIVLPFIALLMLCVGLLAALGPAWRGLRIQPTQALRED